MYNFIESIMYAAFGGALHSEMYIMLFVKNVTLCSIQIVVMPAYCQKLNIVTYKVSFLPICTSVESVCVCYINASAGRQTLAKHGILLSISQNLYI